MDLRKTSDRPPIKNVYFTFQPNLLKWVQGDLSYLAMPVLGSGRWNNIYLSFTSLDLIETYRDDASGGTFQYELVGKLPAGFIHNSTNLAQIRIPLHALLLVFEDNTRLAMGNEHEGAIFTYTQSVSGGSASVKWTFEDTQPAQRVQWLEVFYTNQAGHLIQKYQDANTYVLRPSDKHLIATGPTANEMVVSEGRLIQKPE